MGADEQELKTCLSFDPRRHQAIAQRPSSPLSPHKRHLMKEQSPMRSLQWKAMHSVAAIIGVVSILSNSIVAHSQTQQPAEERANRVTFEFVPPENPKFQEAYDRLRENAGGVLQKILSPFRLPEPLTIKTKECGVINAWYGRENSKATITLCYDLLEHILQSLPKETTPEGITEADAAWGQYVWLVTHEFGHALFDMYDVPIFGHEEAAADGVAAYIMLRFGQERARHLVGGAAWSWRSYISDYRNSADVRMKSSAFSSNHGQPEERFYDLMCMAFGADPVTFAHLTDNGYLPPTRAPGCKFEYDLFASAFHRLITPHVDQKIVQQVLDELWLPAVLRPTRSGQK